MAKATPTTAEPIPPTFTLADVHALAGRLQLVGTTSRRVDWDTVQPQILLAAKFLRALTRPWHSSDAIKLDD
jgi:hypothetical protein